MSSVRVNDKHPKGSAADSVSNMQIIQIWPTWSRQIQQNKINQQREGVGVLLLEKSLFPAGGVGLGSLCSFCTFVQNVFCPFVL